MAVGEDDTALLLAPVVDGGQSHNSSRENSECRLILIDSERRHLGCITGEPERIREFKRDHAWW
jgi:hypothetical protein